MLRGILPGFLALLLPWAAPADEPESSTPTSIGEFEQCISKEGGDWKSCNGEAVPRPMLRTEGLFTAKSAKGARIWTAAPVEQLRIIGVSAKLTRN